MTEREKLLNESFMEWDTQLRAFHFNLATHQSKTSHLEDLHIQHQHISALYKQALKRKYHRYSIK